MFSLKVVPKAARESWFDNLDDEPAAPDLGEAIRSIAQQASKIGRESAEVRGLIDDTTKASQRSAEAVASLGGQVKDINGAQRGIGAASNAGLAAVQRVRAAVEGVGHEVGAVMTTLRDVAQAAESITQIALQTRLVAFNASVEAKRAGDAGRAFGVVADAVKDLAGKVEQSSKDIKRTVGLLDERIDALAREIRIDPDASQQGAFQLALADVQGSVSSIIGAAEQSRAICAGLDTQMSAIGAEMNQTGHSLGAAMKRSETFLDVSEHLIELVAACGIETEDTPFIQAAIRAADTIAALLEEAMRQGSISREQLFDENYRVIPNTNPVQHTTQFIALADRLFPAVQERVLELSQKIVFCISVDRNGYVATHNRKYNHPQRGDLAWDSANSRYRRIFNDRTGLASARNQRPFLLQTYRRDMGGGSFIVMKEVAAPITVAGAHWGGLRLAFKF
ncbi:MAG: methyl-accepting chemotaxis protein [Burkholderiales bacterium]